MDSFFFSPIMFRITERYPIFVRLSRGKYSGGKMSRGVVFFSVTPRVERDMEIPSAGNETCRARNAKSLRQTRWRDCVLSLGNHYTAASLITPLAPIVPIVTTQSSRIQRTRTRLVVLACLICAEAEAVVVQPEVSRSFLFIFRR